MLGPWFAHTTTGGVNGRSYSDADFLEGLLLTGAMMMQDSGLSLYGWTICPHPVAYNNCEPYGLNRLVQGAIYVKRDAWRFDDSTEHFDVDCTLTHLLKERILLRDNRFFWDFGVTSGNFGGQQSSKSRHTGKSVEEGYRDIKKKWGKYFILGGRSVRARVSGGAANQIAFGVLVRRRSSLAVM